jgi:8-amino-7-oxononanoate synthase
MAADIFEKCYKFTDAKVAMEAGYYPFFIPLEESEGTEFVYQGKRFIMAGSNNYLGLTTHPKVRQAAIDAINKYGTSCTGSRFMNGTLTLHVELERELAEYVGKEAALVFSTGYQTNLGTISALVGKGDFVITDKDDHASIIDGCMLSRGKMLRFKHGDMADLERVLKGVPKDAGKLVVTDGVFSMGGDIAPLPEMLEITKKYGARLMVDDAHSIGVLGGGHGTSAYYGVTDEVDLIMGTFSKSFASLGGFIAGDFDIIHYIQHHARSLIFSASISPPNAAAARAALQVMKEEPERIQRLLEIGDYMRENFKKLGFDTGPSQTPVVPIVIRDEMKTIFMWKALFEAGVYVNAVIPPGVAPNMSLLRTSYMATHTQEQLDKILETFERVGKEMEVI